MWRDGPSDARTLAHDATPCYTLPGRSTLASAIANAATNLDQIEAAAAAASGMMRAFVSDGVCVCVCVCVDVAAQHRWWQGGTTWATRAHLLTSVDQRRCPLLHAKCHMQQQTRKHKPDRMACWPRTISAQIATPSTTRSKMQPTEWMTIGPALARNKLIDGRSRQRIMSARFLRQQQAGVHDAESQQQQQQQ